MDWSKATVYETEGYHCIYLDGRQIESAESLAALQALQSQLRAAKEIARDNFTAAASYAEVAKWQRERAETAEALLTGILKGHVPTTAEVKDVVKEVDKQ